MTAATLTLTDFLLARIAEDESAARAAIADDGGSDEGFGGQYAALITSPSGVGLAQGGFGEAAARMIATYAVPARVLAECDAKRRIVEYATSQHTSSPEGHDVMRILAAVYSDHAEYRDDWRP